MNHPASVTVFGVLNIVVGGLGVIGMPIGYLLTTAMPQFQRFADRAGVPPGEAEMMQESSYHLFAVASTCLGVVFSALLVVAGFGLLNLRPWARHISVAYAICTICAGILGPLVSYFSFVKPTLQTMGPETIYPGLATGAVGGIVMGMCWPVYAVALLLVMFLPGVKAAFRQGPVMPVPPEYQPPPPG